MTGANRGLQAKGGRKGTAATRLRHAEQGHPGVDYPVLQTVPTKRLLGLITPGAADAPTKKLWPLVNLEAVLASCLQHGLSSWRKLGHTVQDRGIWMMPMPSYNRAH